MKIKMTETISGTSRFYKAGEEIEVSEATAIRFISRGYAVPVRGVVRELAIAEPAPEVAAVTRGRKKRGKPRKGV